MRSCDRICRLKRPRRYAQPFLVRPGKDDGCDKPANDKKKLYRDKGRRLAMGNEEHFCSLLNKLSPGKECVTMPLTHVFPTVIPRQGKTDVDGCELRWGWDCQTQVGPNKT